MNHFHFGQASGVGLVAIALLATLGLDVKPQSAKATEAASVVATAPTTPVATPVKPLPEIQTLNTAFADLAQRLSPTVVNVYTKLKVASTRPFPGGRPGPHDDFEFFFENPFDPRRPGRNSPEAKALGSGFVIDHEGHIVTNAHVVLMAGHQADEVMVQFNGETTGKGHPAKIVGVDESSDVAVLKLTEKIEGLKPVVLGDSDRSRVGEWVLAIGNPYGHSHTVTQGIISALGRSLDGVRADFLQTSASINPGNSGGPLFNMSGEVVGINTAIDPRAQGIGFAIPVNTAKQVIAQLKATGKVSRPWLGISIQDLSEDLVGYMKLKEPNGVLINGVMAGTPAAKAGLESYDIITKVNSSPVKNSRDLIKAIEKIEIGQRAKVEILRQNKVQSIEVVLAEQPTQSS